jgi:putative restriction endonuclease
MPIDFATIQIGIRYDRPTLARMWGYKGHQVLARGVFTPKDSPHIILFVTRKKQTSLTQYDDYLSGDRLFWEGEKGHLNDERISSAKQRGEIIHLFYREIHHTLFEYKGPIEAIKYNPEVKMPSRFVFGLVHDQSPMDDIQTASKELEESSVTERHTLAKARIGQGAFREKLLKLWQGCAVTGAFLPSILKASHVKPWRLSDNRERLDPYNGLLLLPQYDCLFDAGLVAFTEEGKMLRSKALVGADFSALGIPKGAALRRVDDRHIPYLRYHRQFIFSG